MAYKKSANSGEYMIGVLESGSIEVYRVYDNATKKAIDIGLKYVNNDACYPSICTTGQLMEAL